LGHRFSQLETFREPALLRQLKTAAARGAFVAGIDTGAFILADARLLDGHRATVHYEHIDSFQEEYPSIEVVEDLFVVDGKFGSCCGGAASLDFALHLVRNAAGIDLANAAARYLFHERIREGDNGQNPRTGEPIGYDPPVVLRQAIRLMEQHLEQPLPIPEIAARASLSQRRLERLFREHTRVSAVQYYVNARLDRARGLVTQTSLAITEIALASGFPSLEHFSRAYRKRHGLSPRQDRVKGRVPFEYRAWPMHSIART
jgi:transcriptional regulator GlxA family with amidase domain